MKNKDQFYQNGNPFVPILKKKRIIEKIKKSGQKAGSRRQILKIADRLKDKIKNTTSCK